MKMSDLEILATSSIRLNLLNEGYIDVPTKPSDIALMGDITNDTKHTNYNIYIRTGSEGTRAGAQKGSHSCSIKAQVQSRKYEIPIPTKAYETLSSNDKCKKKLKEFKQDKDSLFVKAVTSFIYDNQMAIIAYWYQPNSSTPAAKALFSFMKNQMKTNNYAHNRVHHKTSDELEVDKEMLTNYVRKECQDDTIILHFGS